MIPSTTNRLLVTEDWTKIYQSFRNADFQSYDFDTLRRTMIAYLRERYPEEFNDYIESSEYIALIDLIAFLGQNLSFRIDLNARENFLETAERRESILRLARLINYNAKRNVPASGFLKLTNISTTDSVFDANGVNLANTLVSWNDATNPQWYQQFITVINGCMPALSQFGKPNDRATIDGITTEVYQVNSVNTDAPVYSFSKNINGTSMVFEIVSSSISNGSTIMEDAPLPGRMFNLLYKNDNRGSASSNTGFFVYFKQGSLALSKFTINAPVPNEIIGINAPNINDTDVWLWQLNSTGNYDSTNLWTKVDSLIGNNIIYNSVSNSIRNIYSVLSREQDQIDLNFADGSFGDLPKGQFSLFYRQSNGLTYTINPENISNISVQVPYQNTAGQQHQLTLILSLQYAVTNAAGAESNADIKTRAPQVYYTQNRMITAEDYNIAPLAVASDILKIKSVNRTSSGVSKYFELSDVSGKYSKTNIFATDGILYSNFPSLGFNFSFTNRNEIISTLKSQVATLMRSPTFKNFYIQEYDRVSVSALNMIWKAVNTTTNQTRGYFYHMDNTNKITDALGTYASAEKTYFIPDTLIKFIPPSGKYFLPSGKLTTRADSTTKTYIWAKIINVVGDGTSGGFGFSTDGTGPVVLSAFIPSDAIPVEVIPKFVNSLTYGFQLEMVNRAIANTNFGVAYNQQSMSWYLISEANLDKSSAFSLTNQADTSNTNKDASWMMSFVWDGRQYKVTYRTLEYIFESERETAFFVDDNKMNYDFSTDSIIKDHITVLSINTDADTTVNKSLDADYIWQIDTSIVESDGYVNPKKIQVSFYDAKNDGQLDDPDAFTQIVKPSITSTQTGFLDKFVYFMTTSSSVDPILISSDLIMAYPTEPDVTSPVDGGLYYFYGTGINVVKLYSAATATYILQPQYIARSGRDSLKFHYVHNSGDNRRIDPSKTNLIDLYVLSKAYDVRYRNWLMSGTGSEPLAPTSQTIANLYSSALEPIKAISDEIIFHPAKYRVLFGSVADISLQAVFKAVRNSAKSNSDNDLKSRILSSISEFFNIDNWEFGQTFYFSELSTYVMNQLTPDITNLVIVPKVEGSFGELYEIKCQRNEIFVSGVTVNDIEILSTLTASDLKL